MAAVTSESLSTVRRDQEQTVRSADLTVARQLFEALDVLDSSAALRRALTDPAREAEERAGLVRELFGGRADQGAVTLLEALASQRWSRERDLGDAVEVIAVDVVAVGGEREGLVGLEALESSLLELRRAVMSSHELQRAMTDQQASSEAKLRLAAALSRDASDEARLLIDRAVTSPRGLRPEALIERFAEQIAQRQQRWIAQVTVAKSLDQTYRDRLSAGLNRYFGRDLKLDVVVDPSVVGGIRVQVGDEVVDSTVSSKVGELRRRMAR
ncbi:F0F1 ATP synthase subunit delta [Nesterenkonia marinintestina]|uniref:F0F1 ATP synthase subunit delta n=1 Tax=Nesterenkonia marinintestina TaxID=2979865 RepID=UPI0021C226E0|nr:F0F1 ATP synthase subunit delta [Nesterenkonia sp. GX14115]